MWDQQTDQQRKREEQYMMYTGTQINKQMNPKKRRPINDTYRY